MRSMKKQLFFMAMLMAMSLSASAQQQVTISLPRQSFEGGIPRPIPCVWFLANIRYS